MNTDVHLILVNEVTIGTVSLEMFVCLNFFFFFFFDLNQVQQFGRHLQFSVIRRLLSGFKLTELSWLKLQTGQVRKRPATPRLRK